MGKIAFIFSGQGAQYSGMGKELYEASPAAKAVYDMADSVREGTSRQCFEGSTPAVAVARLRRWMRSDPEMWNELQSAGYRPYSRRFTPEQVSVLRRYLL